MNQVIICDIMHSKNGQWKKVPWRARRFMLSYIMEGVDPLCLGFDDYESAFSFMAHEYKKQGDAIKKYMMLLVELENENARLKSLI